jgi:hypothetical protein
MGVVHQSNDLGVDLGSGGNVIDGDKLIWRMRELGKPRTKACAGYTQTERKLA